MKARPKQYARAFFESLRGVNEDDLMRKRFDGMVSVLDRDGVLRQGKEIMRLFSELWDREFDIMEAVVTSAHSLDATTRSDIKHFLEKHFVGKTIHLVEHVDQSIVGGIKIEADGELMDASVAARLQALKKHLVE